MKQRRKTHPFAAVPPAKPDLSLPTALRELPQRIAEANWAGPRYGQSELAARAGLAPSTLSRLAFSTNLVAFRVDTLCRIAAALDVSVAALLGDGPPPRPVRKKTARKRVPKPAPKPARKKTRAR
jgi:transcriptional regulator with XRE-family HTH domain